MSQPAVRPKKKLDALVKIALGVFFGSLALIFIGMFLTRPDRSIPPYSIGSQAGTTVFVNVPAWTSDSRIEALINRFRMVGRDTRNFGSMKIQPTTPDDPAGRYRRIAIYVFTNPGWAEPDKVRAYVHGKDPEITRKIEREVRGYYRLEENFEEGRIGPLLPQQDSAATEAYSRVLFRGPIEGGPAVPAQENPALDAGSESTPGPSRLSDGRGARGP